MPPSRLASKKRTIKDNKKKTKSRNGCGRCKTKRLKCDETSPECLQCKRRNVICPGYEKALKWSTKYEVFQPIQLRYPLDDSLSTGDYSDKLAGNSSIPLTSEVVDSFEALAAVLLTRSKPTTPNEGDCSPTIVPDELTIGNAHTAAEHPLELDSTSPDAPRTSNSSYFDKVLEETQALPQDSAFDLDYPEPYDLDHLEDFSFGGIDQAGDTISPRPVDSQASSSLLLSYYRIPSPSSSSFQNQDSMLIQHYFQDVCVLFSSFDSALNPFRVAVAKVFQDTASIYYGIQSMAAAHLANTFPHMGIMGLELQSKAYSCLKNELTLRNCGGSTQTTGKLLLSILLLGLTTSWHSSSSLGQEFLRTARSLILPKLLSRPDQVEVQRENQFFEESLIYWEMLMGFVTQDTLSFSAPLPLSTRHTVPKASPASQKLNGKIVPHPWTGVAPTVFMLFAEVGRVVHRERILRIYGPLNPIELQAIEDSAKMLEQALLGAECPSVEELADPGDERTSKHDLLTIAEAYRCAGLLEIYRIFPSILRMRLEEDSSAWSDKVHFDFSVPRLGTRYEAIDKSIFLTTLALHILTLMSALPSGSGTCCTQPIILLTAGSELQLVSSVDYFDVYANDAKVLRAREFVDRRLGELVMRLPRKPIVKVVDIVREVWWREDNAYGRKVEKGGREVFWMDVMVEKGWQTVMG
ncbi:hypothetical protein GQ43DRAFT_476965 [Delitschia confertaspora ATCC 74209]|uniref:Zn(2)-C6 fungal-type domain-containing protein n=1 Tax=Delitschia confertaspora ATCC 74209 TaxID=1513339 RepID=A0A9P4JUL0_9PLEO|nr:hypothetical protein GQ43DRAFT_476965 [Delitschia confertaspora ATCC 74209]